MSKRYTTWVIVAAALMVVATCALYLAYPRIEGAWYPYSDRQHHLVFHGGIVYREGGRVSCLGGYQPGLFEPIGRYEKRDGDYYFVSSEGGVRLSVGTTRLIIDPDSSDPLQLTREHSWRFSRAVSRGLARLEEDGSFRSDFVIPRTDE